MAPGSALHFDSSGRPTAMKTQKKDFYVPLPDNENALRNRFEVMGACLEMLKMRFMANPVLATASIEVMREYADFLCGDQVWAYVVKGGDGQPLSCPHIGLVRNYDFAIRTLQHRLIKGGLDFAKALEKAMHDNDTRTLNFTTPFSMEAQGKECRALTAPGLSEQYNLPGPSRPLARPQPTESGAIGDGATLSLSKNAKARLRKKTKQEKARKDAQEEARRARQSAAAATRGGRQVLALGDIDRNTGGADKGKGKGKGKGKLPAGIKTKSADNKPICFAFSQGRDCNAGAACTMAHVCWWCLGNHPGGPAPGTHADCRT